MSTYIYNNRVAVSTGRHIVVEEWYTSSLGSRYTPRYDQCISICVFVCLNQNAVSSVNTLYPLTTVYRMPLVLVLLYSHVLVGETVAEDRWSS